MYKLGLLLALVGLVIGGPPVSRSRADIESFRNFLEKSRAENGFRLSERMLANPKASPWENSGKFEGDIVLDDWQIEGMVKEFSEGRNAYIWPNTKWPNDTVVYEFASGHLNTSQRELVMDAIRDIENHTCVRFRERRAEENYSHYALKIRKHGLDFCAILQGDEEYGCYAHIGYWSSRGPHMFNLADDCFFHAIIVHEWLHIIGFFHMQATHNRDDYVRIEWENIEPGMENNFERHDTDMVDNLGLPYEYTSCMHYGPYAFSTNGEPTIVALHEFEGVMGQQDYVTSYDWLRVNRHYNCPGAWSTSDEDTSS